jgi:mannose-6-phosphate isomerase-like protein (cupin superfamily)
MIRTLFRSLMTRPAVLSGGLLAAVALATPAGDVEPVVLSSAQLESAIRSLASVPDGNKDLVTAPHHTVRLADVKDRNGDPEMHSAVDDIFYVLRGKATLRLGGKLIDPKEDGPGEYVSRTSSGYHEASLAAGSLITVPRGTVHQVMAKGTEVVYLVIKAH